MSVLFPHTAQPKQLRPYQAKAIDLVKRSFGKGNRRVVCKLPTGAGKTLIAANIIKSALAKGKRCVFTAPAIQLIGQTVEAFESEGIDHIGVLQASHPREDESAPVQVCSVQTLAKRGIPDADLFIVDECHIRSKVVEDLMDTRKAAALVGLSATPWAKGMGLRWDDLVIPCTIADLIEWGYLSKFAVYAPDTPDMSGVKVSQGDYAVGQTAKVMSDGAIVGNIVENWLSRGGNRPTLLFAVNCAHARLLHRQFEGAGVSSAYVDARVDRVERQQIEDAFRAGEVRVACSVRTLTTGVDWPVSCIIDAAPTKSPMLHVQKIGRGLRVNPGTEDLIVFDHAGNSTREGLGIVTDISYPVLCCAEPGERSELKRCEKLPRECAECSALFSGPRCPCCGYERKAPPSEVEMIDGKLVRIVGAASGVTPDDMRRFYGMAVHLCRQRGYKPGWATVKFKEKFGMWPPHGMPETPIPPDRAFLNWEKSRRIAWARGRKVA